jgi:xanthine phosphoribosyltransferase
MHALRERILSEGRNLGAGILKVDGFINHQIDPLLMFQCGKDLASRFRGVAASKVLTAEMSGIGPALFTGYHMGVPVVYARKSRPITMPSDVLLTLSAPHSRGLAAELIVSPEYLSPRDRLVIIDDFLSSSATILGLAKLADAAGANVVGVGVLIEKRFEGGREALEHLRVPVHALACITAMDEGKIQFA